MFRHMVLFEIFLLTILILDGKFLFLGDFYYTIWNLVLALYLLIAWLGIAIVLRIESYHKTPLELERVEEFTSLYNMEDFIDPEMEDLLKIVKP